MSQEATRGHAMAGILQQDSYTDSLRSGSTLNTNKSPSPAWPKVRDSLRQFRLQCVSCILGRFTYWTSDIEHRKVAIYRSRQMAATHSLLHLFPLVGAASLLILQWTKYWIGPQISVFTFLQFAAKFHELTMQASIIEVLLCVIRTEVADGYVPLGALSGLTQATQLSYLWSLDFVSIVTSPALRGWRKAMFLLAIPWLLILTSLVGPSSAILMIPRPDNPQVINDVTLYVRKSSEELYAPVLSRADGMEVNVQQYNVTFLSSRTSEFQGSQAAFTYRSNSVVQGRSGGTDVYDRLLRGSYEFHYERGLGRGFCNATIPSDLDKYGFHDTKCQLRHNYDATEGNRSRAVMTRYPVVATRCRDSIIQTSADKNHAGIDLSAEVSYIHDNGTSNGTLFNLNTLVDRVTNLDGPSSAIRASSVNRPTYDVSFPPIWMASPEPGSHSSIVVFPFWSSEYEPEEWPRTLQSIVMQDGYKSVKATLLIKVCTMSASWNSGETQLLEKSGTAYVQTGTLAMSEPVNSVPISLNITDIDTVQSPEFFLDILDIIDTERALSELFAIAISWTPAMNTILETRKPADYDERNMTSLRYTTTLYGYGYGNRTKSIRFAIAVMVTYCVIIIAYVAYTLITGSTSTAWNSGIELVALALQSKRPDHLGNIAVGLDSIETFKEGVGICVNRDNELELVFAHDRDIDKRGLRKIERNKEY